MLLIQVILRGMCCRSDDPSPAMQKRMATSPASGRGEVILSLLLERFLRMGEGLGMRVSETFDFLAN